MCTKCKDDRCVGMYLLHHKELKDRFKLMKKELTESASRKFILIKSPSSGELFTSFFELHIIDNVNDDEAGKLIDRRYEKELIMNVKSLATMTDDEVELISTI